MGGKKKPQEKCSEASKPANTSHVPTESKPESSRLNAAEGQTPIDPEETRKANNEVSYLTIINFRIDSKLLFEANGEIG